MSTNIVRNIYYASKRFANGSKKFIEEITKPTSFIKGEDFENCLRKKVYTADKYELVMKTHDYYENKKDYVKSSLYPDYLFRDINSNKEFWVEAKYRENLFNGKINWCSPSQFKRYKNIPDNLKVIIAIGFGGRPNNPNSIYLIPLEWIKYYGLYKNTLREFEFLEKRKKITDVVKDKFYDFKKP